jgi:hypothetical protein
LGIGNWDLGFGIFGGKTNQQINKSTNQQISKSANQQSKS